MRFGISERLADIRFQLKGGGREPKDRGRIHNGVRSCLRRREVERPSVGGLSQVGDQVE